MSDLTQFKVISIKGGEPQATQTEMAEWLPQIPDWRVIEREGEKRLERVFKFKNFDQALAFTGQVAQAAVAEDHHPALLTEWGKVTVTWSTHKIHGLHMNDFIMAAKTDEVYVKNQPVQSGAGAKK